MNCIRKTLKYLIYLLIIGYISNIFATEYPTITSAIAEIKKDLTINIKITSNKIIGAPTTLMDNKKEFIELKNVSDEGVATYEVTVPNLPTKSTTIYIRGYKDYAESSLSDSAPNNLAYIKVIVDTNLSSLDCITTNDTENLNHYILKSYVDSPNISLLKDILNVTEFSESYKYLKMYRFENKANVTATNISSHEFVFTSPNLTDSNNPITVPADRIGLYYWENSHWNYLDSFENETDILYVTIDKSGYYALLENEYLPQLIIRDKYYTTTPTISWTNIPGVSSYKLEISTVPGDTNNNFSNIIFSVNTSEISYTIPSSKLTSGKYYCKVSATTVSDSFTSKIGSFTISIKQEEGISKIVNVPNPLDPTEGTTFYVKVFNNEDISLEMKIEIYTLKGNLIKEINTTAIQCGWNPLYYRHDWDCKDKNENLIENGIYLYKIILGNYESEYQKMAVVRDLPNQYWIYKNYLK